MGLSDPLTPDDDPIIHAAEYLAVNNGRGGCRYVLVLACGADAADVMEREAHGYHVTRAEDAPHYPDVTCADCRAEMELRPRDQYRRSPVPAGVCPGGPGGAPEGDPTRDAPVGQPDGEHREPAAGAAGRDQASGRERAGAT